MAGAGEIVVIGDDFFHCRYCLFCRTTHNICYCTFFPILESTQCSYTPIGMYLNPFGRRLKTYGALNATIPKPLPLSRLHEGQGGWD